jgi:hypothetical protein
MHSRVLYNGCYVLPWRRDLDKLPASRHRLVFIIVPEKACQLLSGNLLQVFFRPRQQSSTLGRCWKSASYLRMAPGCHHFSVMHAHSGGLHGITLRINTKHSWRCSQDAGERIASRLVLHPLACQCDELPSNSPLDLERPPSPPPPMTPTQSQTCPPAEHNLAGWEVCVWMLTHVPSIPATAKDLEGIVGLDVCSAVLVLAPAQCFSLI